MITIPIHGYGIIPILTPTPTRIQKLRLKFKNAPDTIGYIYKYIYRYGYRYKYRYRYGY